MPTRHLRYLFDPASTTLIGASDRPGSLGAALACNLLDSGFKDELFLLSWSKDFHRFKGMEWISVAQSTFRETR